MDSTLSTSQPTGQIDVKARIDACPRLASLRVINSALRELLNSEHTYTAQIADIIGRDQSLATRLLQLVNSVFYGLASRVSSLEDAIFYLGVREIRALSLATPVIEDLGQFHKGLGEVNWRQLWQHSIGTGILTREIYSQVRGQDHQDADYLTGLLHNVGKIVMAHAFPEVFEKVSRIRVATTEEICEMERRLLGWDHAQIGAYYLSRHRVSENIIEGVEMHNAPEKATHSPYLAAAVQVADHMVRSVNFYGVEVTDRPTKADWEKLPGWEILFGDDPIRVKYIQASLDRTIRQLPNILNGMI